MVQTNDCYWSKGSFSGHRSSQYRFPHESAGRPSISQAASFVLGPPKGFSQSCLAYFQSCWLGWWQEERSNRDRAEGQQCQSQQNGNPAEQSVGQAVGTVKQLSS